MPNALTDNPNVHYVKFMRGSTAAWETLKATPEKISDDTLYFVYQDAQTSQEGKLYLGLKLISGVGGSSSGDINLNDIGDVNIDGESLSDKQILVYNDHSQSWENTSLSEIIDTAVGVMVGATAAAAGVSGLVPVPAAGDQAKFLRGDGTWATIDLPTFNNDIFSLDSNHDVILNGYNLAPVGSIPIKTNGGIQWSTAPTGTLDRQITTLEKLHAQLDGTDPDPISTNTIYMVPNNNSSGSSDRYSEYMIINNQLELLGTFGQVDLVNYVTVTTFNQKVGELEDILYNQADEQTGDIIPGLIARVNTIEQNYITSAAIGDLNQLLRHEANNTLVDEVNAINTDVSDLVERLKWKDIQEENT